MYRQINAEDPDEYEAAIVYEKGAAFLHVLESHFGRARFDAFLRGYFDSHRFQSMTTPQFLEILRKELFRGDRDAWAALKVDEWVSGVGLPANVIVPSLGTIREDAGGRARPSRRTGRPGGCAARTG